MNDDHSYHALVRLITVKVDPVIIGNPNQIIEVTVETNNTSTPLQLPTRISVNSVKNETKFLIFFID